MTIKTSKRGLDLIARHEGLRLKAYRDVVGVWTIGYGHTSRAGPPSVSSGMRISKKQALDILARDVAKFERAVREHTGHIAPLNQNEFDALVSFAFNLGPANLKKLVRGRGRTQIAAKILLYDRAGGQRLRGLTKRRKGERALFLKAAPPAKAPEETIGEEEAGKAVPSVRMGRFILAILLAAGAALIAWLGD